MRKKFSQLRVPNENTCCDKITILYRSVVQYVHQLTRKTYAWAKKFPCSHNNFDQLISVDTRGTARYRLILFPVKVETILHTTQFHLTKLKLITFLVELV